MRINVDKLLKNYDNCDNLSQRFFTGGPKGHGSKGKEPQRVNALFAIKLLNLAQLIVSLTLHNLT